MTSWYNALRNAWTINVFPAIMVFALHAQHRK